MADVEAAASGGALGELFEYKLKQPVTVRRNQSAMVPVVQHDVAVERVSLWSAARGMAQPLRAVWLTNDTGLTLDGGSLTLVEGGAFAGEGLVEAIKPGEKRFVSYAVDLGVRVTIAPQGGGRHVSRIRIASSVMTQSVEERASTLYTIRNDDATPRDVVIEHPARAGWTLTSGVKPAESSATAHRFRVTVAPASTATLTVGEMRPIDSQIAVSNISDDQIALILRGRNVAAGIEPQLRAVAAKSRELAEVQRGIYDRQAEIRRISEDQARVRENLKALKGSDAEKALTERYTRQLSAQEDRLDALRKELVDADGGPRREAAGAVAAGGGAVASTSSCPDVSDPLRRLPDLAAHLAAALAGPLPGARIHDRLSPRLLDGSLPSARRPRSPGGGADPAVPARRGAARRAHRARRRSPPPRRSDLAARRTPGARRDGGRNGAARSRRGDRRRRQPASPSPAG